MTERTDSQYLHMYSTGQQLKIKLHVYLKKKTKSFCKHFNISYPVTPAENES